MALCPSTPVRLDACLTLGSFGRVSYTCSEYLAARQSSGGMYSRISTWGQRTDRMGEGVAETYTSKGRASLAA